MKSRSANFLLGFMVVAAVLASCAALCADGGQLPKAPKVKVLFPGGEAVATLYDNPLAEAFVRQLPLEAEFSDFGGAEKIFYLPEKLPLAGAVNADTQKGDFCYYAPWGNIAVFYKGYGHGKNLYVVGNMESGKEKLAAMEGNFRARIKVMDER